MLRRCLRNSQRSEKTGARTAVESVRGDRRYDVMPSTSQKRTVCVLIFDEVEVLDLCGPFEVFSVTGGRQGSRRLMSARWPKEIGPLERAEG